MVLLSVTLLLESCRMVLLYLTHCRIVPVCKPAAGKLLYRMVPLSATLLMGGYRMVLLSVTLLLRGYRMVLLSVTLLLASYRMVLLSVTLLLGD
jgi:hypothetical protein